MIIINVNPNYVGYANHNLDRQIKALTDAGVPKQNIYCEQANSHGQPQLRRMLSGISRTTVVVILNIAQLGHRYKDLKHNLTKIASKEAGLVILTLPITKQCINNAVTSRIVNELIIELASYRVNYKRKIIRQHRFKGIAISKANGKYPGKQVKFHLNDQNVIEAIKQYFHKSYNGLTTVEIARMHGMSASELYKLKDKWRAKNRNYTKDDES